MRGRPPASPRRLADRRGPAPLCSERGASRRRLRRGLHPRAARAPTWGRRAIASSAAATGCRSIRPATSRRAAAALRRGQAASRARPRRGDLGALHRADHHRAWAGVGDTHAAAVEMERRWTHSAHFELYEDALPALEALVRPRAQDRPALELLPRPRRVRRPPRARRRCGPDLGEPRQDEATRVDLPGDPRAARGRPRRGADGRRHPPR